MKARLSRPKRSIASVAWEGRSGEARASKARAARVRARAQRKRPPFRWGGSLSRRPLAGWAEKRPTRGPFSCPPARLWLHCARAAALLQQITFSTASCSARPCLLGLECQLSLAAQRGRAGRAPRLCGPPGLTRLLARFARLGSVGAFSRSTTPAKAHSQRSAPNHEAQKLTPHSCARLPKPRPGHLPR